MINKNTVNPDVEIFQCETLKNIKELKNQHNIPSILFYLFWRIGRECSSILKGITIIFSICHMIIVLNLLSTQIASLKFQGFQSR